MFLCEGLPIAIRCATCSPILSFAGVSVLFKVGLYLVDVALKTENSKTCPTMFETCQKLRNIPEHFLNEEALLKGIRRFDLKDSDLLKQHNIQVKKFKKIKNKK